MANPRVTIVVCAYGELERTYHCLYAIGVAAGRVSFEVIVVDDASPDDTATALGLVTGIRVVTNESNLGYLRSANKAAALARGDYLVLLNNDTAVRPGWLEALVDRADADPSIGAVGGRLIDPSGRLQEAGCIVWQDGSGWNYGRGWPADDPRVARTRDVDYCSAAALLVRASAWHAIGGFDERFVPAYYEDVDLCFALRERGLRVVYEPGCVVVHAEGGTHGTDETVGIKARQPINLQVFAEKWHTQLTAQRGFDPALVYLASERRRSRHLLVVEVRLPDVTRDAGSVRLMALIAELRAQGWTVHFHHLDGVVTEPAAGMLDDLGVHRLDVSVDFVDQLIELAPDLDAVWISRPEAASNLMTMVAQVAPAAEIVYDTVDLAFVRADRYETLGGERLNPRPSRVAREFELAAIRASDLVITVSDDEAAVVSAHVPDVNVHTVGLVYQAPDQAAPLGGRRDLLFIGGWEHQPNLDAAQYLVNRMLPLLRPRLPGVRVRLVGSHVSADVRALGGPDVDVLGWLPDLTHVLSSARAFVAPLRWGAGVKGKIVQALGYGLPVVTTPVGAEGMQLISGEQVLIGGTLEELVDHVVAVMTDDQLAQRIANAGRAHMRSTLGPEAASKAMRIVLDDIVSRRDAQQSA